MKKITIFNSDTQNATRQDKKEKKIFFAKTHVILADLADELLGFVHGSGRWGEDGERLLVHLIYCHALKKKDFYKEKLFSSNFQQIPVLTVDILQQQSL